MKRNFMETDEQNCSNSSNSNNNIKRRTLKKNPDDVQKRKEKAIEAMNELLNSSQRFSNYFLEKLKGQTKKDGTMQSLNTVEMKEKMNMRQVNLKYFRGTLFDYQIEGLNWLKFLHENNLNGILADEMGLGKTIQVIALICHLFENNIPGPYLIMAPLSTLPNWMLEFQRFAPKLPVIMFHGTQNERFLQQYKISRKFYVQGLKTLPIVVTSYNIILMESKFLQKFNWQYIIVDEGSRIKNPECQLLREMRKISSNNRLILTGTPMQNSLLELWSLLNFLLPKIFDDAETFSALFEVEDFQETDKIIRQEQTTNIISTIHGVLAPFMLQRHKVDVLNNFPPKKEVLVYCPVTELQRDLYKYVLQKNINKLRGIKDEPDDELTTEESSKRRKCTYKTNYNEECDVVAKNYNNNNENVVKFCEKYVYYIRMTQPMMILKKIVNHPFTIRCPVDENKEVIVNEDIVKQSGKMLVLDAMLVKLKENKHKVLIFCTMTEVLDFVEDYMSLRKYQYCRLDGKSKIDDRQKSIKAFNNNPNIFIFLISTKAGGLGINLSQADTVIFFDRDWNPQVDIQAQDRCHRIGQKKPVMIYSLIAKGTIDESIIRRANAKRRMEKIVIKKGKFTNPESNFKKVTDLNELEELLNSVGQCKIITPDSNILSNQELNSLLDRSELFQQVQNQQIKTIKKQEE